MIGSHFLACALVLCAASAPAAAPVTSGAILADAPAGAWAEIDPADLLVMDLRGGGRVVIALAPMFAPRHVANIGQLARSGWFDGTAVERVQDDYVTQWGASDEVKPPPAGLTGHLPAEYERPARGLPMVRLPFRDSYAPEVGLVAGFPVATAAGRAWLVHCYGMVGVGRDLPPDSGDGRELNAVIGHAPRALDRNIALVGRVVSGTEALSALPRGTGDLGFYRSPEERTPILRARLAADLPAGDRPRYEWLRPTSGSYRAWMMARANRADAFFVRPAGAIDLCNALPPVRPVTTR